MTHLRTNVGNIKLNHLLLIITNIEKAADTTTAPHFKNYVCYYCSHNVQQNLHEIQVNCHPRWLAELFS